MSVIALREVGMEKAFVKMIRAVIKNCEDIQNSNESDYTKQSAKISAYEMIVEILRKEKKDGE